MKINLKKYLLYSSVIAIFTEAFFFNFIIDWKLLYLIIFINSFLILKYYTFKINKYFAYIIITVFLHGIISYSIISIPINYMISQIIGISIVGLYFYNIILLFKPTEVIDLYVKLCYWVALLGYIMFFLGINLDSGQRLMSVFKEPAHYVIVVIPACYYFFKTKQYKKFLVIFGTLILSGSSLGYLGCGLMFILPNINSKRIGYLILLVPITFIVFYFVYNESAFFKMRVDDTYNSLNVINTGKFKENTNLSSYVMIVNLNIAKKNISEHPFGSGIGSHHYMFTKKYIKEVRPPENFKIQKIHTNNSFDANSLATRLISEFGILGIISITIFLVLGFIVFSYKDLLFYQGVFIYLCLKLFRDGHYFPPELFFFFWLFFFGLKNKLNITK